MPNRKPSHISVALALLLVAGSLHAQTQPTTPPTSPPATPPTEQPEAQPESQPESQPKRAPGRPPRAPQPAAPKPAPAPAQPAPAQPVDPNAPRGKPVVSERPQEAAKAPTPKEGTLVVRSERFDDVILAFDVSIKLETRDTKVDVRTDPKTGKPVVTAQPNEEKVSTPIESASLILPYPIRTASSTALGKVFPWEDAFTNEPGFKARLTVNDQIVDVEPEVLQGRGARGGKGYAGGATLAKLVFTPEVAATPPTFEASFELATRVHDTLFDEPRALLVGWPTIWPDAAASTLTPQLWIHRGPNPEKANAIEEYDPKPIADALTAYLAEEGINDPKAVPPVLVAKVITSKLWRDIQPTGDGLTREATPRGSSDRESRRTGFISGYTIQAPALTLITKRGSPFDIIALHAALLHQAGIPARPIIGVDTVGDGQGYSRDARGRERLRVWLEFALYDQAANELSWVPVDVLRLRQQSQRPAKLEQTWKFFGTHDELRRVVPLSVGFSPNTDVATYASASPWGWFVTPKSPEFITTRIAFSARSLPKRGGPAPMPTEADGTEAPAAPAPGSKAPAKPKRDKLGD